MEKMLEDDFYNEIQLIPNHLDSNAGFDGNMFETFGEEIEFVLEMAKQNRVITILETENFSEELNEDSDLVGLTYETGYHLVNRIGYLITKEPLTKEFFVEV